MQKTAAYGLSSHHSLVCTTTPGIVESSHQTAFEHSVQPSLISAAINGKILCANEAACELFGYSLTELLLMDRKQIFDTTSPRFITMMSERKLKGKATAEGIAFRKNRKPFP